MGQQHRKETKRRRRSAYIKRQKELAKNSKNAAPVQLATKVVKADAEGYKAESATEIDTEVARAQAKADYHCFRMQGWLYENRAQFPELAQVDADRIAATLRSAASCGIWLGGARGNWYSERNRDLWEDC